MRSAPSCSADLRSLLHTTAPLCNINSQRRPPRTQKIVIQYLCAQSAPENFEFQIDNIAFVLNVFFIFGQFKVYSGNLPEWNLELPSPFARIMSLGQNSGGAIAPPAPPARTPMYDVDGGRFIQ